MKQIEFNHSFYRNVYVCSDGIHSREFPTIDSLSTFVEQYESLFPDHSFDFKFFELHIYEQSKS